MDIATAATAGELAVKINLLQSLLTKIDTAIAEKWPVTTLIASAPAEGSTSPHGTPLDLLGGLLPSLDETNSQLALKTAKSVYQQQYDALVVQLNAL